MRVFSSAYFFAWANFTLKCPIFLLRFSCTLYLIKSISLLFYLTSLSFRTKVTFNILLFASYLTFVRLLFTFSDFICQVESLSLNSCLIRLFKMFYIVATILTMFLLLFSIAYNILRCIRDYIAIIYSFRFLADKIFTAVTEV